MLLRALLIEVQLLNGRYHGGRDWPPSPFRLFQALVAGAYGGRWRAEPDDGKDAAFRWLEQLDPPHIVAGAKLAARATNYFVPNNDLDAVGGDPRRIAEIRVRKTVRPVLFDSDVPCIYAWSFENGENHARSICEVAERLHTLGLGIDAAFARAEVCAWDEAIDRLESQRISVAKPSMMGNPDTDPTCPMTGSLDSLKVRHRALVNRFESRRDGRAIVTLFRQPPKAQFRAIAYDRPPARFLFELRSSKDSRRFRAVGQERVQDVVISVRDHVAKRLSAALPNYAAEIARVITGIGAGPADIALRVRFVPLPSIGREHTEPSIRRILLEVPVDCPLTTADIEWAVSGQSLPGFEAIDGTTGEILDETILTQSDDDTMLRHYGIGGRAVRHWHTVTPAALPEPSTRGRIGGDALSEAAGRHAAAVAASLRHAGLDCRGADIRVQRDPFIKKGMRADAIHPGRFVGRLHHVSVIFRDPVHGPIAIGDGRWLGLGIMAPSAGDMPPDVHLFGLDPADAPLVSEHETIVRALRRAVMARVDEEFRRSPARRHDPLPSFFTGHEPEGAPARPGHHEHLFFLADDIDGDGRIDRLAVIAPHLADRTVESNDRSTMRDLRLLDRALSDLTTLRAGRAGAPRLLRMPEPGDDDPVFGRATHWVSRTLYRPTRHPKGGEIKTAIADDLLAESARRGLPRPNVEVLDVRVGPRGGLAARAQLKFEVAVAGPLLLGRGSHFGEGMFTAE